MENKCKVILLDISKKTRLFRAGSNLRFVDSNSNGFIGQYVAIYIISDDEIKELP